jgi:hypothetical protein
MGKSIQHISFQQKQPSLWSLSGFFVALALSVFSFSARAVDASNAPSAYQEFQGQSTQPARSASFQKRVAAEQMADEQRARDYALQEQARLEELELRKIRAERAAQRNAAAAAAKQQQKP